jgi:Ca-activated chloride channel family protein
LIFFAPLRLGEKLLTLALAAVLTAQDRPDISVDVDLVTVACSVTDRTGAPVRDLKASDFTLTDNGAPREIRNFWQEADLPLTVALVADISGSQAGFVKSHRDAIAQFLKQVVGPRDRAMIVEVDKQSRRISALTGALDDLNLAVQKIGTREGAQSPLLGPPCRNAAFPHGCGGTALWHALDQTALALQPVTGRKAIVVLSDGIDTGSDVSLSNLIEAAQSAETVVYSIRYESPARFLSPAILLAQALSHGLDRLDLQTGGLTFPNPGRNTAEIFSRIEADIRNTYVLGFTPPAGPREGRFHQLEVKTTRSDLTVRFRPGYWR